MISSKRTFCRFLSEILKKRILSIRTCYRLWKTYKTPWNFQVMLSHARCITYYQETIYFVIWAKKIVEESVLTVHAGLSGVRIAPFFRRLFVLVVVFPLVVILLVFGSRIDAPSFREFASLRIERLVQHFHGFPWIRLTEQATWYARGHRSTGQHCEVNFATNRSYQHLEDVFCFYKSDYQLARKHFCSDPPLSASEVRTSWRISYFADKFEGVQVRFLCFHTFSVPRRIIFFICRSVFLHFSVKFSRKFVAIFLTESREPN